MQDIYDHIAHWCDGETTIRMLMAGIRISQQQLYRAIINNGHLQLARLLLDHGANVRAEGDYAFRRAS
jgi:hypothetical protein